MTRMVFPAVRETMFDSLVAPKVAIITTITDDDPMFIAPVNDRRRHTYWNRGHKDRRARTGDGYSHREPVGARCRGRRTDSNRNQTE